MYLKRVLSTRFRELGKRQVLNSKMSNRFDEDGELDGFSAEVEHRELTIAIDLEDYANDDYYDDEGEFNRITMRNEKILTSFKK